MNISIGNGGYRSYRSTPMKIWQVIVFGAIFLLAGCGVLFYALKTTSSYNEKSSTYTLTTGKVTSYVTDDEGLRAIVVTYNVDDTEYTITSNSYSTAPKSIGTSVDIKYNPNSPSESIFDGNSDNIILFVMSGLFIVVGIILIIKSIIKGKRDGFNTIDSSTVGNYIDHDIE